MIPEYPKIKPVELEDIEDISSRLNASLRSVCELCIGNLYIWKDTDQPQATIINNNLCLMLSSPSETPYFLEPLGHHRLKETAETCVKHAGRMSRISESFAARVPAEGYKITPLRDQFDYIFETAALTELKGKKFDAKRNHIKKFQRRFPQYAFVPLEAEHKTQALELFEKWFSVREESRYFPKFAHDSQKSALNAAFNNFEKLKLAGGAIFVDKQLKAFILGSRLSQQMVSAHFSYTDPELQGISQTLLMEACSKTFNHYAYINLEQDAGIPGLRKAKLSYYPLRLEKKFEITTTQP